MKLTIFATIKQNILPASKRYWPSLLCSLLVTCGLNYLLDHNSSEKNTFSQEIVHFNIILAYGSVLFLGIANMLAINPSLQSKKYRFWGLGILVIALLYWLIPINLEISPSFSPIHCLYYSLIVHLIVAVLPFLWSLRKNTAALWRYNQNLLFNFILSGIYSVVLFGGLSASVFTINSLILKNLFPNDIYGHLASILFVFGHQLIFAILLTKDSKVWTDDSEEYENPALKNFIQYIQVPILLIYLFILYLYLGKILYLWQLPKGTVSFMILIFGVIGIFTVLLSRPFENQSANVFLKKLSKNYFRLLIPLLPLLLIAVSIRIAEYGLTEMRVSLLYLDTWLALIVIYYTLAKKPNILIIPVTLLVFTIACRFLPYFNSGSWSLRNQQQQLKQEFKLLGMVSDKSNKIDSFSWEKYDKIWEQEATKNKLDVKSDSLKKRFVLKHSFAIREKLLYIINIRKNPEIFEGITYPWISKTIKNKKNYYDNEYDLNNFILNLNLPLINYNRFSDEYNEIVMGQYDEENIEELQNSIVAEIQWPINLNEKKWFGVPLMLDCYYCFSEYRLDQDIVKYELTQNYDNNIFIRINRNDAYCINNALIETCNTVFKEKSSSQSAENSKFMSKKTFPAINFNYAGHNYRFVVNYAKIKAKKVNQKLEAQLNNSNTQDISGFLFLVD